MLQQIQQMIAGLHLQITDHDIIFLLIGAIGGMYIGGRGGHRRVIHAARRGIRAVLPF